MADVFTTLVEQVLGRATVIQPLVATRYEPTPNIIFHSPFQGEQEGAGAAAPLVSATDEESASAFTPLIPTDDPRITAPLPSFRQMVIAASDANHDGEPFVRQSPTHLPDQSSLHSANPEIQQQTALFNMVASSPPPSDPANGPAASEAMLFARQGASTTAPGIDSSFVEDSADVPVKVLSLNMGAAPPTSLSNAAQVVTLASQRQASPRVPTIPTGEETQSSAWMPEVRSEAPAMPAQAAVPAATSLVPTSLFEDISVTPPRDPHAPSAVVAPGAAIYSSHADRLEHLSNNAPHERTAGASPAALDVPPAQPANPVSNRLPDVSDKRKRAASLPTSQLASVGPTLPSTSGSRANKSNPADSSSRLLPAPSRTVVLSGAEPVVPLVSQVLDQTPAATTLPSEKAPSLLRPAERTPNAPSQAAQAVDHVTTWPSSVSAKSKQATISQAVSQPADALVMPADRPTAEAIDSAIVPLAGQPVSQLKVETPIEPTPPMRSAAQSASALIADTSPADYPAEQPRIGSPVEGRLASPTMPYVSTPHQANAARRRVADDQPIVPRLDPFLTPDRSTRGIPQPEAKAESRPTIRVTIGRIEVRTTPTASSQAVSRTRSAPPALALQDYLKQNQARKP